MVSASGYGGDALNWMRQAAGIMKIKVNQAIFQLSKNLGLTFFGILIDEMSL